MNASVLLLDPLILFEKLELPLFGLFSLPLSLGRDLGCKERAPSNHEDQGDDNDDDHGDCDDGAAIPQRLEDIDVFVLGGFLDEVERAIYFMECVRRVLAKGERSSQCERRAIRDGQQINRTEYWYVVILFQNVRVV